MPKKPLKIITQKVKVFRRNNPIISILMWGINYSMSELSQATIPAVLLPEYFKAYLKVKVENCGFNKDKLPSNYKFKEYFPMVFRDLRERFNIDDEDYCTSMTKYDPQATKDMGRSGSKLYRSYDLKYFVKTISKDEVSVLHKFIPHYHHYLVKNQCETLLCKYVGLYRITVNQGETYILVQKSCFPPIYPIHKKYDLKGSTVSRQATTKERKKELPTLKDNDFMNELTYIDVDVESREILLEKLKSDVEFLRMQSVMDYSLIIGVHDLDAVINSDVENDEECQYPTMTNSESDRMSKITQKSTDSDDNVDLVNVYEADQVIIEAVNIESIASDNNRGTSANHIYIVGIIDFNTTYGMKKRTAHSAKTLKHGADAEISTVNPDQYAKRFINFISKSIR
ncbi:hypothetical protein A3Q56_03010 [Intoshia linei]|uniref:1-phosphatidylinositol-5-phosphate 4-kinase n=1 Tax=Intoshia linei TaxID=1819745 RepID=A0A177B664_9BILA|nr:hypothetical protein A3Q56_03010 [Intoshia linei]